MFKTRLTGPCAAIALLGGPVAADAVYNDEWIAMPPAPPGFAYQDFGRSTADAEGGDAFGRMDPATGRLGHMIIRNVMPTLAEMPPAEYVELAQGLLSGDCPGSFLEVVDSGVEEGVPYVMALAGCPQSTIYDGPETFLMKAMGGAEALFAVRVTWPGTYSESEGQQWIPFLIETRVCSEVRTASVCTAG